MWDKKENAIREKRTGDAVRDNLMGPTGKFGVILRAFGTPVLRQGSGLFDVGYVGYGYDDVYSEYEGTASGQNGPLVYRDELPEFGDDAVHGEGLLFDGLSRGLHLEIVYWHAHNEIRVSHLGYTVYKESSGVLEAYNPSDAWLGKIEKLYQAAKKKMKSQRDTEAAERAVVAEELQKSFWARMKDKWGFA